MHDERVVTETWPAYTAREAALADLQRAIEREPAALDARFYRASFLREHGRFDEAIGLLESILAIAPDHVETLVALSVVLVRRGRRLDARAALERAVASDEAHLGARVNLANLLAVDEPQRAEAYFAAVLERDPQFELAHRGLCTLAVIAGDMDRAARHRSAGYSGPFGRLPYYGERMPVPVVALVSTDGGNIAPATVLDPHVFLVNELFVEAYRDEPLPPHRAIVNAIADADRGGAALTLAAAIAARANVPVLNAPAAVALTGRLANAARLAGIDGIVVPQVTEIARDAPPPVPFPFIVRVPGHHMGRNMRRVNDAAAFAESLATLAGSCSLLAIPYIETRSPDGAWRKYRVMCIDGVLYPLHLAIAQRWDVHYFSAAMSERADYRTEEARFLDDPASTLGARAWTALGRIGETLALDYLGIDFGLTDDGRIVLFEANAAMTASPPDPDERFAYRRPASDAIAAAVREMVLARARSGLR